MVQSKARTVKEYLDELPPERRREIAKVRSVVRKNLPKGYRETMSWSGSLLVAVPSSGIEYHVRIVPRHGGDTPNDDVGRWSAALRQRIGPMQPIALPGAVITGAFLMIVRFRIQDGAATIGSAERVVLDVLTFGTTPTEYRVAECGPGFEKTQFQRWPDNGRLTLPGYLGIGRRTLCVQVRGESSLSPVARDDILVVPMLIQVDIVPTSYAADAGDAWAYGLPRGFGFEVDRVSPLGSCVLGIEPVDSRNVLVLWAFVDRNAFAPVTCRVDLFQGRELEPGWSLVGVNTRLAETGVSTGPDGAPLFFECTGDGVGVDRVVPPSGTRDPHVAFTLSGDPDASDCLNFRLFIDTIDLTGPIFGDWRDAFGP